MHFQGPIKQNAVFAVSVFFFFIPVVFHGQGAFWALRILRCVGRLVFLQEQSERRVKKKNLIAEEAPNVNVKISLTPP